MSNVLAIPKPSEPFLRGPAEVERPFLDFQTQAAIRHFCEALNSMPIRSFRAAGKDGRQITLSAVLKARQKSGKMLEKDLHFFVYAQEPESDLMAILMPYTIHQVTKSTWELDMQRLPVDKHISTDSDLDFPDDYEDEAVEKMTSDIEYTLMSAVMFLYDKAGL